MENNIDKDALDAFLENEKNDSKSKTDSSKKVMLDQREGLIERVDKILVTKEGKQLLREQY